MEYNAARRRASRSVRDGQQFDLRCLMRRDPDAGGSIGSIGLHDTDIGSNVRQRQHDGWIALDDDPVRGL